LVGQGVDRIHFVAQSKSMKDNPRLAIFSKSALVNRNYALLLLVGLALLAVMPVVQLQAAEFPKGSFWAMSPRGDKITIKFEDKEKFSLKSADGKVLVTGKYKISKNQIEFTDETGPIAAKDAKPGKYEWNFESDKLSFSKIEDESDGRSKGLTRTPWTPEK
jgi:hypothetical protein